MHFARKYYYSFGKPERIFALPFHRLTAEHASTHFFSLTGRGMSMRAIKSLNILAGLLFTLMLSANLSGCSATPASVGSFSIGGTVSGLTGTGLVLQDNGGDNLAVSANGAFTFATSVGNGKAFSVTVL